jgi:hypothetical protein
MRTRWKLAVLAGTLVIATSACVPAGNDDSPVNGEWLGESSVLLNVGPEVAHPGGFGGWYVEDGAIHVYTEDPREDPEAAFAAMYLEEPPNLPMPIVAVQSLYPLSDLQDWARQVNEANKGYVTLSYESISSRIMYGVLALEDVKPAIAFIESVGVPRAAFEVHIDHFKPEQ